MPLFSIKNDRFERVKEVPFKSEHRDIQHTTESSLKEVFGYEFVMSELSLGSLRIDTLAFDNENNLPKNQKTPRYKTSKPKTPKDQLSHLQTLESNRALPSNQRPLLRQKLLRTQRTQKYRNLHQHRTRSIRQIRRRLHRKSG